MFEATVIKWAPVPRQDILAVGDFTYSSFCKFKKGVRERKQRDSAIPMADLEAAVNQILSVPFLGGRKGALKLLNDQKGLLGETLYSEIKAHLILASEKAYFDRKLAAQLEKDMYKRTEKDDFQTVEVSEVHEVWAIDYTCFDLLGVRFGICVVYELYSQAYLAVVPGLCSNIDLAIEAVTEARNFSETFPQRYLLSDNGSQFCSDDFQEVLDLAKVNHRTTPRGKPWYNGALESGNRDLKRALYTIAMYKACEEKTITRKGTSEHTIFGFLKDCCSNVFTLINDHLPRVKFGLVPNDIINNRIQSKYQQNRKYVDYKRAERKQLRHKQKEQPRKALKSVEERVSSIWNRLVKTFDDDTLFAARELLHGRYNAIRN